MFILCRGYCGSLNHQKYEIFERNFQTTVSRTYLVSVFQDNDATGGEAEEVFDVILANDGVQVDAIHVQPLHFLEVSVLRLARHQPDQPPVGHLHRLLHLLRLGRVEPELGDVTR